ncbi:MAG: RdgB/HAM1 family non-canonical purine NTP pyrophosphatase [bacterium]
MIFKKVIKACGNNIMKVLVVATNNSGKFKEIKTIIEQYGITAMMPDIKIDVEEGTVSYEENAKLKAYYVMSTLGVDALGEDSGIEVLKLGGFPGVISARFVQGTDLDRNIALLDRMKNLFNSERRAIFKAYAVIALKDGSYITGYGELKGKIIDEPKGDNGFGYDPIFVPDGYDMTLAQLPLEVKNSISHRKKAIESVVEQYIAYYNRLMHFGK